MHAAESPKTDNSIPGAIESSSLGQEVAIFHYVLYPICFMVLSRLRHIDRNCLFSIMFYSDLIPGRIESSSLGQELRVLH